MLCGIIIIRFQMAILIPKISIKSNRTKLASGKANRIFVHINL